MSELFVVFVRHGITDWNREKRMQGAADIPLNEEGRAQARAVAARVRDEHWDAIYSSDMSRARETAEIIAEQFHIEVQIDKRLRERDQGKIEGTNEADRVEKWGKDWRTCDLGIETDEALYDRAMAFLTTLAQKAPETPQRILVVSHGGFIGFMAKGIAPQMVKSPVTNTSLTTLRYVDENWECVEYNCALHLAEI